MKKLLSSINEIVSVLDSRLYIVGGWLRDRLLGRSPGDVDLLVEVSARSGSIAASMCMPKLQEAVHRLNGTLVVLDEGRGLYRLIVPAGRRKIQLDIDVIAEGALTENLAQRDFTINALALPLSAYLNGEFEEDHVIDPLGGLTDLRAGLIRVCGPDAVEDDPLRALRAFRLAARLEFAIEPRTLDLIKHAGRSVTGCAGERVWDELRMILSLRAASVLRQMDRDTRLLEQMIPEVGSLKGMIQGGHHVDDAWEHSLKVLEQFEGLWHSQDITGGLICCKEDMLPGAFADKVVDYLNGYITRSRTRLPIFKLACLLHDVGKQFTREYAGSGKYTFYGHHRAGVPVVRAMADRLRMSGREKEVLAALVGGHMDPLFLYKVHPPTPMAVRRFFKRVGQEVPGLLLLSLADISSTRLAAGREDEARAYAVFIKDILRKYFNERNVYAPSCGLLNGHEVCALLGIKPSPPVRRVLETLADARVEGKVKTKAEAEAFVLQLERKGEFESDK
ncbi:HD domain-containing protein [Desulfoscipio gibsoniae]